MTRRVAVSAQILVVVLLSTVVTASVSARTHATAAQQIRAVLDRQVEAWNRGDLEGFMEGYWRSPQLTFYSGGVETSGWDQTIQRYQQRYRSAGNEMGILEFLDLKIELLGPQAAFVRGKYRLKASGKESSGLFTLTFKKFASGWKIIHDHTST
ncbi:MAG TPA: nuclear transport factor 2 family protein [Blastocatellia bacterium]|nr:nuclear transport factor 2 family protein [Blastocatellia bacterium]